jgi:hypothetical protein
MCASEDILSRHKGFTGHADDPPPPPDPWTIAANVERLLKLYFIFFKF